MRAAVLGCILLQLAFPDLSQCGSQTPCPPVTNTLLRLTIDGRRNQTGHLVTKVDLEHTDVNGEHDFHETKVFPTVSVDVQFENCSRESPTLLISSTITVPPPKPGPSYQLLPGLGYYKVHDQVAVWKDALGVCYSEGAHLAVINSELEAAALKQLMTHYPKIADATSNEYMYIGFNDLTIEGRFVTIFGDTLDAAGFARFIANEPNNNLTNNNEDCGLLHRSGGLADVVCHWKLAFICEQELD